jgi:hypothetical protein
MTNPIEEKVWDISIVVEEIKKQPQTYETILKGEIKNGTLLTILQRKLNKLSKDGILFKVSIPATRYSRVIYFTMPKPYHIIFESSRFGSETFYFETYKRTQRFYIHVDICWKLVHDSWQVVYNKMFFEGSILRML